MSENAPFVLYHVCSPPFPLQAIFFGGIDPSIRGEVWPFLLHYYSYDSTSQEREAWRLQKRAEYYDIQQRRWAREEILFYFVFRLTWCSRKGCAQLCPTAANLSRGRSAGCQMLSQSNIKPYASVLWLLIAAAEQSIGTIREVLRGGAGCDIKGLWRKKHVTTYQIIPSSQGEKKNPALVCAGCK